MSDLSTEQLSIYLKAQTFEWLVSYSNETEWQVIVEGDSISIGLKGQIYKEDLPEKIPDRNQITSLLNSLESNQSLKQDLPFISLLDFFWREQYLKKPLQLDAHKRVSKDSIQPEYLEILGWPIFDILMHSLLDQFGVKPQRGKTVTLSCDYDFANIWNQLNELSAAKQLLRIGAGKGLSAFYKSFQSMSNAEKELKWNGSLNREMFSPDLDLGNEIEINRIAFLLIHQTNKNFDPKNNTSSNSYSNFLSQLAKEGIEVGLHPGYDTRYQGEESMILQKDMLQSISSSIIQKLRFHYLNADLPHDLRLLEAAGIKEDYSFAFADTLLFRSGRSTPCRYWDFELERMIDVLSVPLTIMDTTLVEYSAGNGNMSSHLERAWTFGQSINILFHNQYFDPFIEYPKAAEVQSLYSQCIEHLQALSSGNI